MMNDSMIQRMGQFRLLSECNMFSVVCGIRISIAYYLSLYIYVQCGSCGKSVSFVGGQLR